MNAAELTKKLQVLAVKHDVLPSSIDDATLGAMLFDAAQMIPADQDVSERITTEALHRWIGGNGSMLRYDVVELRRLLVDWQFIKRDGFGRAYRRCTEAPQRFAMVCAMSLHINFEALIADARAAERQRRDARKVAHLTTQIAT